MLTFVSSVVEAAILPWRTIRLAVVAMACGGIAAVAAEDTAGRPVLTDPDRVWQMTTEERALAYPIRVEGRVNFIDRAWRNMWIEGPEIGARYIALSARPPALRNGQRVRLEGSFVPAIGLEESRIRVTVLEESAPVVPLDTAGRLGDIREFDRRVVTVVAYVDDQQLIDAEHLRLHLIVEDRPVICWVPPVDDEAVPDWRRRVVRVQAVYSGRLDPTGTESTIELWVAREQDVEVIGAITEDPAFEIGVTPIARVSEVPAGTRVHVRGRLQAREVGEYVIVRDDTGEIQVHSLQRERMPAGAHIEAVGRLARSGARWVLESALFRRVAEPEDQPAPDVAVDAGEQPLRRIEQVRELNREQAERGLPVDLSGSVVWSIPGEPFFYLHDVSGGVRVHRLDGRSEPPLQKAVRVVGRARPGPVGAQVEADVVHDLGTMAHPKAPRILVEQARTGRFDGQWVGIRGFLREVVSEGDWRWIHVTSPDGEFVGHLQSPVTFVATPGSLIRINGVCESILDPAGRITGTMLRVPFLHDITIEEDAPADPFGLPLTTLDGLRQLATLRDLARARVAGTVLDHEPGAAVIIQDGGTAKRVLTRDERRFRPGDRIEAVGIVGSAGARVILREAAIRMVGGGAAPEPVQLTASAPLERTRDERLVRMRAEVASVARQPGRLRLTLQDGAAFFEALLPQDADGVDDDRTRPGAVVDVTGRYRIEFNDAREPQGFHLRLRDAGDLALVSAPRFWTVGRLLGVSGLLAGVLVLAGSAVVTLRRRVQQQTGEIKRQLERQASLEAELERAQRFKALGLLAGGIAHDFNNLLTTIMGNASIALFDKEVARRVGDSLRDIEDSAGRAHQLTQQLVTFARGGDPMLEPLDLACLLHGAVRRSLTGAKARAEIAAPAGLWPVRADRGQLARALDNLILRGRGDDGLVSLTARNLEIDPGGALPLAAGRYVALEMRGCGGPVPPDELRVFFDPYAATTSDTDRFSMAIVYSIIKRHGGHITVESSADSGTVFNLWIPAADSVPVPESAPAPEVVSSDGALRGRRVLLMDDEETIRRLGERCLRHLGCEAQVASDGGECVRIYEAALQAGRRFDAVILDLTVPGGLGGREAIEALRRIDPDVRAIVSSGYSNDPVMARYREHGFVAVVPKPYSLEALTGTLQRVLGK